MATVCKKSQYGNFIKSGFKEKNKIDFNKMCTSPVNLFTPSCGFPLIR